MNAIGLNSQRTVCTSGDWLGPGGSSAAATLIQADRSPLGGSVPKIGTLDDIDWDHFAAVEMRVGRIVEVEDFPEARKPAWKLGIDFGPELGSKRSSAQITNYAREELEGRLVVGVVNFPPRQIGPVRSEVLVLGAVGEDGVVHLLEPDADSEPGDRIA
jgi:tRNA-binding protein